MHGPVYVKFATRYFNFHSLKGQTSIRCMLTLLLYYHSYDSVTINCGHFYETWQLNILSFILDLFFSFLIGYMSLGVL